MEKKMFAKKEKQADLEIFVIYDSKSESYGQPAFAQNKNVLMRELLNMFQDPSQAKNQLFTNSEDYSIFKVGSYDKKTGLMETHNLEHVANLHDLRSMANPQ